MAESGPAKTFNKKEDIFVSLCSLLNLSNLSLSLSLTFFGQKEKKRAIDAGRV
jgi:hypothetical protein